MMATRPGAAPRRDDRFSRPQTLLILLAFALLVALRLPNAWVHGRFQDEEATVFLAYAWHFPWDEALFRPFAGYWNLAANASTLLLARAVQGGILPLEYAPYVTMTLGLLAQLYPAFLVLTGEAKWLSNRLIRLAAVLIIGIAPTTEEVFLNVMHIQFHMALCAALILSLDVPRTRARKLLYAFPLVLAPLCGPGAIAFLPLYVLRAFLDRSPGRLGQVALLGTAAAVQMLFFYSQIAVRSTPPDLLTSGAIVFLRLIALPFAGSGRAGPLGAVLLESQKTGTGFTWTLALATAIIFGSLLWLSFRRRSEALWLFASAVLIAYAVLRGGINFGDNNFFVYMSGRYNYLSTVLVCWGFLAMIHVAKGPTRSIFVSLAMIMLGVGLLQYPIKFPFLENGPSWKAEVTAWRANPDHRLRVWPDVFAADLSGKGVRCPTPHPPGDRSVPRYCDAGWMTHFYDWP